VMTTAVGIVKKVKRTGETALFIEATGKLTEDTLSSCRVLGIEPRELYSKRAEDFMLKGVTAAEAEKQLYEHEERRKHHIELILKEASNSRLSNRKTT